MRCVYCDRETGDEFDEHEACVDASLEASLEPGPALAVVFNPTWRGPRRYGLMSWQQLEPVVEGCRVFWGSHGCCLSRGHDGPHACDCCECSDHERDHEANGCVARPPYYGENTRFYGEDVRPGELRVDEC